MHFPFRKSGESQPLWLILAGLCLPVFYIFWEVGKMTARNWDQETFLYSYNDAFLKLFAQSETFPQWNPYLQSGVSLNPNMPFPFSLSKLLTLLTGDGVWGFFLSESFLLAIASLSLLHLLKKMGIRPLVSLFVLFVYLEFQLALYSPEALSANVAVVLVSACLAFAVKPRLYLLALASLYLGVALNNWAPHATLAVFPFQLLLVFFLRKEIDWKRQLTAIGFVWFFGVLLSLPTLLPLMADSKESQKVLTYSRGLPPGNFLFLVMSYFYEAFAMKLSRGMIWVLTFALGLPLVFWPRWKGLSKAFVRASYLFFAFLTLFYFFQGSLALLPVVGKLFSAFNPMRPTIVGYFCVSVLLGLALERFLLSKEALQAGRRPLFFLFLLFLLLFFLNHTPDLKAGRFGELVSRPDWLVWLMGIPFLALFKYRDGILKWISVVLLFAGFAALWGMTGARYYTRELPRPFNPVAPLPLQQITIFPGEDAGSAYRMTAFLQDRTKGGFQETADLRTYDVGEDLFQRYPPLQIPTIHGWSNFRPLRAHRFYLWLVQDLEARFPERFDHLRREGGFSYSYGARYDKELLDLMGVRYLVAEKTDRDPRFVKVLEGSRYQILENREAFPRVFLASGVTTFDSLEELGAHLQKVSSSRLREAAFLKEDIKGMTLATSPGTVSTGTADINQFSPNRVQVDVSAEGPSLLVLTQSYHPGWKALLDGEKPLPVYPAYYAFLSVPVPAGGHRVEFIFSDAKFEKSLYIAGTVLGFLLILAVADTWRNFRAQK